MQISYHKLFTNYLESDWEDHVKKNSGELIRNTQGEISKITNLSNITFKFGQISFRPLEK